MKLTRTGAVIDLTQQELRAIREDFGRQHWIRLPQLLDASLAHSIRDRIDGLDFKPYLHDGIGQELVAEVDETVRLLRFVMNDPKLFKVLVEITGCGEIRCFTGRVFRMRASPDDYDSWHDDLGDARCLAMSLNMSTSAYHGGTLQLRHRESGEIVQEVVNTNFGDAVVFRIAAGLQHRVTSITSDVPRTAFAGWFRSEPDFHAVQRRLMPQKGMHC
jgi:2OG-Fe(II) oxygenase superfamily